jgi:hypothetical protein
MRQDLKDHYDSLMLKAQTTAESKFSAHFVAGNRNVILLKRHNVPFKTKAFMTVMVNYHDMTFHEGDYDMNFNEAVKNFYKRVEVSTFNPKFDTPAMKGGE